MAFAIVYSFYAAIQWIFERVYTFSIATNRIKKYKKMIFFAFNPQKTSQGIVFLSLTSEYAVAIPTIIFTAHWQKKRWRRNNTLKDAAANAMPALEENLYLAMLGSPILPTALFWFGWSAKHAVHWIIPMAAICMYGWGMLLIFVSDTTSVVSPGKIVSQNYWTNILEQGEDDNVLSRVPKLC